MNNLISYKIFKRQHLQSYLSFFYKTFILIFLSSTLINTIYANDKNFISNSIKDGCVYLNEVKYEEAIKYFNQALIKARLLDLSKEIADSAYYTALCYYKMNNLKKATEFIEESFFELQNKDRNMLANALLLKACIEKDKGEINQAQIICNKIFKLNNISIESLIQTYLFMTEILLDNQDLKSSSKYLNKTKKHLPKTSNNKLKGWFYKLNGLYHTLDNNFKEAAISYLNMTTSYKKAGIANMIASGLELAAKSFEKDKTYKKAVELYFRSARSYYAQNKNKQGETNLIKATKLIQYAAEDLKQRIKKLTSQHQPSK